MKQTITKSKFHRVRLKGEERLIIKNKIEERHQALKGGISFREIVQNMQYSRSVLITEIKRVWTFNGYTYWTNNGQYFKRKGIEGELMDNERVKVENQVQIGMRV